MKEIRTEDAVGHVLCHDLTRIVPGEYKDAAFRKGHVVVAEDIPVLLSMGKRSLFVWEKQEGMLHEDEAADILYEIMAGANMSATPVKEGKREAVADVDGFLQVDIDVLRKVNSLGGMMIAARHTNSPVKQGMKLAGARVIPLVIEQVKMDEAVAAAGGKKVLSLTPYKPKKYAVITTGSEVKSGLIEDKFTPVIRQKMAEYGAEEMGHSVFGDEPGEVTAAIESYIKGGADIVACTGGMSVDPDDKTPLAIKNTGAEVVSYGAPVLPGAMFMLAYHRGGAAIVGLPGCVMYARRTIFDLVLPRVMADIPVTEEALAALGHGGLCLSCESCVFPNCAFGAGV